MKKHSFVSSTISKDVIFDALAICHATGYPILIIGTHGTAKTKAVLEYASGFGKTDTFKLELSEGTRISELTGYLDMNKLINDKIESYISPIANADCIVINEVDKGNSAIRNSMLGIMAEKMIMRGMNEIPLKYKLFVSTCNHIETSDDEAPFWDRFVIKVTSGRLPQIKIMESGLVLKDKVIEYNIPDPSEVAMETLSIPQELIDKYVSIMYEYCSDRTLFKSINMIAAAKLIWNISDSEAIVKITGMIYPEVVSKMTALIMTDNLDVHKQHLDKLIANAKDIPFVMSQIDLYSTSIDKIQGLSTLDKKRLQEYAFERRNELNKRFVKL